MWLIISLLQNGGTNCPACRGLSTVAMPFRGLQSVIDTLLRAAPYKARTEREKQQADEVYKSGHSLRVCDFYYKRLVVFEDLTVVFAASTTKRDLTAS
jgi:hypothetical protein